MSPFLWSRTLDAFFHVQKCGRSFARRAESAHSRTLQSIQLFLFQSKTRFIHHRIRIKFPSYVLYALHHIPLPSSQVEADAREMSSDHFTLFMNDLNRLIMELVNSPYNEEKMGGIMVIGMRSLLSVWSACIHSMLCLFCCSFAVWKLVSLCLSCSARPLDRFITTIYSNLVMNSCFPLHTLPHLASLQCRRIHRSPVRRERDQDHSVRQLPAHGVSATNPQCRSGHSRGRREGARYITEIFGGCIDFLNEQIFYGKIFFFE
jgi:hypothetical protein